MTPSEKALQDKIDALTAKLAEAQAAKPAGKLTYKVAKSGALSVYGLGRWPTTLYVDQWKRLASDADTMAKFIADHAAEFSHKDDKAPAVETAKAA